MRRIVLAAALGFGVLAASASASAQGGGLPQPREELAPAQTLATLPAGAFLESIVTLRNGDLLIADHHASEILRVKPGGERAIAAKLDAEITGLGLDLDDTLYVTGRRDGGPETIFQVLPDGRSAAWVEIADARFLNGMTLLRPGVFLVADSFGGTIWKVDVLARKAEPWQRHRLLQPNPERAQIPGANGLKVFGQSVYVSNSGQARVIEIPLRRDGRPGAPRVFAEGVVIDDFAFSADGDLYGTTHIFNSVVVLRRDGSRATIAGAEQGVTGSTAVAFGATAADANSLYVVGDGGAFMPPPGGVVPARLVALDVGEPGHARDAALAWSGRPQTVPPVPTIMVRCETAPGKEQLRAAVGPGYLRYLELNNDRIAFAGQLFERPGETTPSGRIYFVKTESVDEARRYIEASPYFVAGMYSGCEIKPFQGILGSLLGGVGWPEAATRRAATR